MAVQITPLGFKKPDGNDPVRNGDNVISDNAQTSETLLADARGRLAQVEHAAGFPGTGIDLADAAVNPLLDTATATRTKLDARYANKADAASTQSGNVTAIAGKVAKGDLVRNVVDYGARPDSYLDDTAAVQSAINAGGITYFPPGTYVVSNLQAVSGMNLRGAGTAGASRTRLRASSGNIFQTGTVAVYSTKVTDLVFDSYGGGADLFTGLWSLGKFEDCAFTQYQDGASAFNVTGWIDMLTIRCTFDHTHTATVPTFKAVSSVGELAQSSFLSTRFTKTGNYAIHLEGTQGSVVENFTIRDTNFEEPKGGAIRLLSARNTSIQNPGMWDFHAGGATKSLIYIGTSPTTGAVSSNNEISHYIRDASTDPVGVSDIQVGAGTEFTTIAHARHQISGTINIDMGGADGFVFGGKPTLTNAANITQIKSYGVRSMTSSSGARPGASYMGAGFMYYDTTLAKPIWSNGTNWTDATGAVV